MSRVTPYQPMQPRHVATEAEVAGMHAKLARRVNGGSGLAKREVPLAQSVPDGAKPCPPVSAKHPVPEWEKPRKGATAVYTKDKRYCCSKVMVQGQTQYELWKAVKDGIWACQLANKLKNFEEAKQLAEKDAAGAAP